MNLIQVLHSCQPHKAVLSQLLCYINRISNDHAMLSSNEHHYSLQHYLFRLVMVKDMPVPAFSRPFSKIIGHLQCPFAHDDRSFGKTGNAHDQCLGYGHARGTGGQQISFQIGKE